MPGKTNSSALAPKPDRILMTADAIGGVWTYALELAKALQEHGIQIALAIMGAPLKREQRKQVKELPNVQIYESNFKLEWMKAPWEDVARAGDWLLEIEQRVQPNMVHLNNFAHGALPWSAPRIVVGHSCVLSWWKAVKGENAPPSWNRYAEIVRNGLQAADYVVAPTQALMVLLQQFYGPFTAQKVIHNARNPAHFHTRTKEEIILAAGRLWDEGKNIALLGTVAPKIPWTIYVAGEDRPPGGSSSKAFKTLCPLGKLPEDLLAHWFAKASIYAAPALYEPFGLSILEAALSGCALVLSNIPSLRENWNGAAVFVSPKDPEELQVTLQRLIGNPIRRKELATYAQCRAIQFNPQHMAKEYLNVYADVLGRSSHPLDTKEVLCES